MREMLEQILKALCVDFHFVALSSKLMFTDIAGAIDSTNGTASAEKYKELYDTWVGSACPFMNETIYGRSGDVKRKIDVTNNQAANRIVQVKKGEGVASNFRRIEKILERR